MSSTSRRETLRRLSLAGLMAPGFAPGWLAAQASPPWPHATGVRHTRGKVEINGRPAEVGMPVSPGDTVSTAADGEAIYVIGSDAFLQRGSSTIAFSATPAAAFLRVVTGRLLSVFGKSERRITTPTATIGIRGTGCYIEAEAGRVYFCLCYGSALVIPHAAPDHLERLTTRHHDRPLLIHDRGNLPLLAEAAVVNHSDAELEWLERLVGRRPPFSPERSTPY